MKEKILYKIDRLTAERDNLITQVCVMQRELIQMKNPASPIREGGEQSGT